jgi:hypothetical protein
MLFLPVLTVADVSRELGSKLAIDGSSVADASWRLGTGPSSCVEFPEDSKLAGLCSWAIYERLSTYKWLSELAGVNRGFNVLCILRTGDSIATLSGCVVRRLTPRMSSEDSRSQRPMKSELRSKAEEKLRSAKTLPQVASLVGAAPTSCYRGLGRIVTCQWLVEGSTPGWRTLARIASQQKRFRLICLFPSPLAPRAPDGCRLSPID